MYKEKTITKNMQICHEEEKMQILEAIKRKNNLIAIMTIIIIFAMMYTINLQASTTIQPEDNQYLELRATTITEIDGQGKQVIMELWGHEIDFKRF